MRIKKGRGNASFLIPGSHKSIMKFDDDLITS